MTRQQQYGVKGGCVLYVPPPRTPQVRSKSLEDAGRKYSCEATLHQPCICYHVCEFQNIIFKRIIWEKKLCSRVKNEK